MADKTTTLKTKTGDNVYPNVIGDNRDNAISDSPQIKHTLTADHKINLRLDTNVNNLINNSLQKPAGLTKTELVGVGTNGQENIEIGDNLTLANGKLSATGGSSGGSDINIITLNESDSFDGNLSADKINVLQAGDIFFNEFCKVVDGSTIKSLYYEGESSSILELNQSGTEKNYVINSRISYCHFITMTNSADNIVLYFTINNTNDRILNIYDILSYLDGKKVLANGNLHGVVPTYISGEGSVIKIYYMTPGDSNINPTPDEYQNTSSFTISDLVTPVK